MSEASAPAALLDVLERRNAAAVALARMASLAVRVEPELLRALRLALLPAADVSAEADLWSSEIVEARSPSAMVLDPDVAALLRRSLDGDVDRIREVIERIHEPLPAILRLEEALVYAALSPDRAGEVEEGLRRVTATMLVDGSRREDLAAWALRALPRLPPAARETSAFWSLLWAAGAALPGGWVDVETAPAAGAMQIDPAVLAQLPPAFIAVERRGDVLRMRAAGQPAQGALEVPGTRPILVEVRSEAPACTVALPHEGWARVDVAGSVVMLHTVDGRIYELHATREESAPAHEQPPESALAPEAWWGGCVQIRASSDGPVLQSGYVMRREFVVTARHAARAGPGLEVAAKLGGDERVAILLQIDEEADVAIFEIDPVEGLNGYEIAAPPAPPEPWFTLGFAEDGTRVEVAGTTHSVDGDLGARSLVLHVDASDPVPGIFGAPVSGIFGAPVLVNGRVLGHVLGVTANDGHGRTAITVCSATQADGLLQSVLFGLDEGEQLAQRYEHLRASMAPSRERTVALTQVQHGMRRLAANVFLSVRRARRLFASDAEGRRLLALTCAEMRRDPALFEIVLQAIMECKTPFEQYAALQASMAMVEHLEMPRLHELQNILIRERDERWRGPDGGTDRLALSKLLLRQIEQRLSSLGSDDDRRVFDLSLLLDPIGPGVFGDEAAVRVAELLDNPDVHIAALVGGPQLWRTRLVRQWLARRPDDRRPVVGWSFAAMDDDEQKELSLRSTMRLLGIEPVSHSRIRHIAEEIVRRDGILLLDGLDHASKEDSAALLDVFYSARTGLCVTTSASEPPVLPQRILHLSDLPRAPKLAHLLHESPSWGIRGLDSLLTHLEEFGTDIALGAAVAMAESALVGVAPDEPWDVAYRCVRAAKEWLACPTEAKAADARRHAELGKRAGQAAWTLVTSVAETTLDTHWRSLSHDGTDAGGFLGIAASGAIQNADAAHAQVRRTLLGEPEPPARGNKLWRFVEWGFSFEPVESSLNLVEIERFLRAMTGDRDLEVLVAPAPVTVRSTGQTFKRIVDAYRGRGLTTIAGRSIRWLAEIAEPGSSGPRKGRWGGLPEREGRLLSATVEPDGEEWFEVILQVTSTDAERPLRGSVVFHLHESFDPDERAIEVSGGTATLRLSAWGSFTVGAETDGGAVKLELDLGMLAGVPQGFVDGPRRRSSR
ncbi:pYEATS domain-containing protein [Sorangium sp. So ce367]|uniref:pYEATS domain-containing protein n=1 Tax=Sorangium sp. So ce367 TaxID=3133305 RepID=UPI003F64214F